MSIFSSMYIGLSGMRAHEGAIGVIGNNVANVNTVGFKGSRAVFADLLSRTILGTAGASQAGQGAGVAAAQRLVTQGALLGTNVTTDLAVVGDGFFVVEGQQDDSRFFTRNGQLQVDNDGFLTTVQGFRLLGYEANLDGTLAAGLSPLQIGTQTSPPTPTTEVAMVVNLDRDAPFDTFDITDPEGSSAFSTTLTIYDSLGRAHQADVYFTQNADGEWEWNAVVPQGDLDGTGDTDPTIIANGNLTFDSQGRLQDESQALTSVTFDGADPQEIAFDFGEELSTGGDGSGSTSFASDSALSFNEQNGYGVGSLSFIETDQDGNISGTFTNGDERLLGALALARFEAPGLLNATGNNLFAETELSGEPAIGTANTGGRGQIFSGSLEQSNVDLSEEFTQLILAQRGFQASSRTVTTADELLVEVVNLKR